MANSKKVEDILKQHQKSLTPAEIARIDALAKKAIEKKYPWLKAPIERRTAGVNRGN